MVLFTLIISASQVCVGVKDTEFSLRVASNGNGTAATAKMMSTDTDISRLADNGKVMDLVMASSAWVSGPSAAASSNSNSTASGKWTRGLNLNTSSGHNT